MSDGQSEALSDVQRDRRLEELHKDLDTILDRLQNMLATNFAEGMVLLKVFVFHSNFLFQKFYGEGEFWQTVFLILCIIFFYFSDPASKQDNEKLQQDAIEIEDLLSGLIEGVENRHPPLTNGTNNDEASQGNKVNNNMSSAISAIR